MQVNTLIVLQILCGKHCYLLTPKPIWRGNKKGISKCLAIWTWQKKILLVPEINEEASGCQLVIKSARMQYAKPISSVDKCQERSENLTTCYKCQAQLPNCWIEDFESFGKK